jgi:hypothetical protein
MLLPVITLADPNQLKCCGYMNSTSPPFVVDTTCTNSLVAENLGGCVGPFSTFANNFLDLVFTGAFGIVGMSRRGCFILISDYLANTEHRCRCCSHSCNSNATQGQEGEDTLPAH